MVNYSVMFLGKIQCSVVRVKAQFGEWIAKDGLIKNILYMHGDRKFFTCEM